MARKKPPPAKERRPLKKKTSILTTERIEFLEPLGEGSPIAGFLGKQPSGGIHHVCYEVEDLRK